MSGTARNNTKSADRRASRLSGCGESASRAKAPATRSALPTQATRPSAGQVRNAREREHEQVEDEQVHEQIPLVGLLDGEEDRREQTADDGQHRSDLAARDH